MHLVPLTLGLCPDLACLVEELDARQPLFRGEVDFSREIVEGLHGRAEDLLHARARVRTAGVDDMLGEVGVVVLLAGRHGYGSCSLSSPAINALSSTVRRLEGCGLGGCRDGRGGVGEERYETSEVRGRPLEQQDSQ